MAQTMKRPDFVTRMIARARAANVFSMRNFDIDVFVEESDAPHLPRTVDWNPEAPNHHRRQAAIDVASTPGTIDWEYSLASDDERRAIDDAVRAGNWT